MSLHAHIAANTKYKATERFSFGYTNSRTLFEIIKQPNVGYGTMGLTLSDDVLHHCTMESMDINMGLKTITAKAEHNQQVMRLPWATAKHLFQAASEDGELTLEQIHNDEFLSALYFRLLAGGALYMSPTTLKVQCK
jgi:hypothetical protein